jgi:ERCC4-type nuclease
MDPFEVKAVLESMTILVDTREQDTERAHDRYRQMGREIRRRTLNYGDYTYNAVLPDGTPIYKEEGTIEPKFCVIERKMDLDELAQCLTRYRKRFEKEFQKAYDNGCRIYLLVEGGSWEDIFHGMYQTRVHPNAFLASLTAWMIRYNAQVLFCSRRSSGKLIAEILRRDLKERLEGGEL